MDDAQYDKRYTNRNRIIIPNGWMWISVPINKDHKFLPNSDVEINNEVAWGEDHWKKIHHSYSKAKFFHLYKEYFEQLYKKDWRLLFELDFETIKQVIDWLGIKVEIIKESELKIGGESSQRLANVCKALGADTYVSGSGGKNYLDEKVFTKENIKVEYQRYRQAPYAQHLSDSFVADLSIIDVLANAGPDSFKLISDQGVEDPIAA